ncbi:hypothetical protein J2847_000429 [Azospirillum agricola]|uniref:SLATT domain-containing protein n=1 Tax=Azospirillum agricola TaxID=1720247 RepID=UPI001AE3C67B|nr:SLATT domain-containing protein [Azospirillum agricola]MBP2227162.1 hypothetical protein [Azospirillum agricola]
MEGNIQAEPVSSEVRTQNKILKDAIKDFQRRVEITRDVRFQSSLRLSKRQKWSSYVVSLLSLYVIAISLIPNIVKLAQYQSQILMACSIVLSVFVIFTSLIDGAQNFYYQGELLHQSARKIATIHTALKSIDIDADPKAAEQKLEKFLDDYRRALEECPINHDNVDHIKELADEPDLFPKYYRWKWRMPLVMWNRSKYSCLSNGWILPHAIAVTVISWVVYVFIMSNSQFL